VTVVRLGVAAVAFWCSWSAVRDWTPPAEMDVGRLLSYYAGVEPAIPADVRVGFVAGVSEGTDSTAAHYLAQYALAPRVVDTDLATVAFVVTAPGADARLDADPRMVAFELTTVAGGGVRVYRRR
jgi:hypothetical protein